MLSSNKATEAGGGGMIEMDSGIEGTFLSCDKESVFIGCRHIRQGESYVFRPGQRRELVQYLLKEEGLPSVEDFEDLSLIKLTSKNRKRWLDDKEDEIEHLRRELAEKKKWEAADLTCDNCGTVKGKPHLGWTSDDGGQTWLCVECY